MTKTTSKYLKLFPFLLLTMILLVSCNTKTDGNKKGEKLHIMSSFSIITDMINQIGKDSVDVHNLIPVGTDPHEYDPVSDDMKYASKADLFFYNGLNLEGGDTGWFSKLLHSVNADENKVFAVTDDVDPKYLSEKNESKEVNPHAFIDPNVGIKMAKAIRDALILSDESKADFFKKNAETYIERLEEVEREYRKKMEDIPQKNRVLVASEQAFQYLTDQYGLKEGFIWAIDTEENGSPDQIKNAINFVKKNKPLVLFVESNVDTRPMEKVSEETGVPIYSSPIFSDELGKSGEEAESYIGYLEYNLKHIYQGLTKGME